MTNSDVLGTTPTLFVFVVCAKVVVEFGMKLLVEVQVGQHTRTLFHAMEQRKHGRVEWLLEPQKSGDVGDYVASAG